MVDRTVTYRLRAELGSFQASMAQASASTRKVAGDMTALSREGEKSRTGLASVGKAAGTMGLLAGAGLAAAVMKAADFDQSMSKVQAATHETTGNMEKLRQAALDAGADTAFSATEAAAGIENLAKAGVSTNEILSGGLMGALDLAAAGEMEVADAAEAAAGAMAQFKLSGADVPHIADLLAAGAGKAQGEVSDMVMALKQGGTVASQTGLSIEETTGALAAMAEQSLLGSDAGTSFKTMLSSLTPNSDKAAAAMEEYNIHAFDLNGNFVGMTELAGQLRDGLSGLTQEQRSMALETIFGSDAVRAASIIYDNGAEGIGKWIEKVDDAGFAAETAAIKQDNLRGDLEKLGGALETALIGTGEGAQGPLRSLVQGAEDLVNAFNKLPGPAKNATAAMLGITAVLGGGLWFTSKVVNGVSSMQTALGNLGVPAGKASGALRAVGKAAAGLAILETGILAIQGLGKALAEDLPGTEALTGQLIDLGSGRIPQLSGEFDSLADSINRVADPNVVQEGLGKTLSMLSLGQLEGRHLTEAKDEIEALDGALSNLASSSSPEAAEQALADLAESQGLSATELSRLRGLLPQYDEAVASAANKSKIAAGATDKLAGAAGGAAGKMRGLANMSAEEAKALEEAHKAAVETGRAFFGLGDKVNDAKVSLGGWLRSLEKQRQALRDFRVNAETAARRGLDEGLIASLQEAGPEGAMRMRQLANASKSELGRANQVWRAGQREVDRYADSVAGAQQIANRGVHTRVQADGVESAISALREVGSWMQNLDGKTATTWVTTRHVNVGGMGPQARATGGYISGPGTATSDSIPALLSNGEYVIKAAAVAKYGRHIFESLNAQRYANGGLVAPTQASVSVAAPQVSMAGTQITAVFPGMGQVVGRVVRTEINAERTYHETLDDRD